MVCYPVFENQNLQDQNDQISPEYKNNFEID